MIHMWPFSSSPTYTFTHACGHQFIHIHATLTQEELSKTQEPNPQWTWTSSLSSDPLEEITKSLSNRPQSVGFNRHYFIILFMALLIKIDSHESQKKQEQYLWILQGAVYRFLSHGANKWDLFLTGPQCCTYGLIKTLLRAHPRVLPLFVCSSFL